MDQKFETMTMSVEQFGADTRDRELWRPFQKTRTRFRQITDSLGNEWDEEGKRKRQR